MALIHHIAVILLVVSNVSCTPARRGKKQASSGPLTCPGFPGYCSESYPGDTCLVVCARGRNNVPECQEDGTWTDVPRCIEHEPGKEEQVPGVCPGIPGYCSLDTAGGLCTFQCSVGPAIRSTCTADGTWEPYPTCQGDPRETQDGCNPCPGPLGGPRNRTAETRGGQNSIPTGGKPFKSGNSFGGGNNRQASGGNNRNGGGNNRQAGGGNNRHGGGNNRQAGGGNNLQGGGGNNRHGGGNNRQAGGNNHNQQNNRRNNQQPAPRQQPRSQQAPRQQPRNQPAPRQQPRSGGGGRNTSGGKKGNSIGCPGDVLQSCIDVCPGFSARVFAACVSGCAKRCPGGK